MSMTKILEEWYPFFSELTKRVLYPRSPVFFAQAIVKKRDIQDEQWHMPNAAQFLKPFKMSIAHSGSH
jgi:hypothetical protein